MFYVPVQRQELSFQVCLCATCKYFVTCTFFFIIFRQEQYYFMCTSYTISDLLFRTVPSECRVGSQEKYFIQSTVIQLYSRKFNIFQKHLRMVLVVKVITGSNKEYTKNRDNNFLIVVQISQGRSVNNKNMEISQGRSFNNKKTNILFQT